MALRNQIIILLFLTVHCTCLFGQIRVVNLTGDYVNYHYASEQVSDSQKVDYFQTMVFGKAPDVYERIYNDIRWIGQNVEERILSSHTGFHSIESRFINLSDSLDIQLRASLKSFLELFPDFNAHFDVYILHSLGIRAGGVVNLDGRDILMFGVEQIVKHFDFQDFGPFFHHELTHLYHNMHYSPVENGDYSGEALYNHLWTEGLAVYVSKEMNPTASQKEVFMRDSLPQKTEEVLNLASRDILEHLYSTDKEVIRKYFWNSSTDPIIPKTAGYYIGYLLVREIAKDYSLIDLFRMKEEDFLPEFDQILGKWVVG